VVTETNEQALEASVTQGISIGDRALMVAVKNIARRLGNDISEASPILDSRLPDGSRVAAVIPPCTLSIRKFNTRHFEMQDLIQAGTPDQSREPARRLRSLPKKRPH
jgi:pilus assembly protein CpaF